MTIKYFQTLSFKKNKSKIVFISAKERKMFFFQYTLY